MTEYLGKWKISKMEMWDSDYIDMVEPGYFLLNADGTGEFVFGTVFASIDGERDDKNTKFEFSWQGTAEGDECCGRGWFKFVSSEEAKGKIYFHMGDYSEIDLSRKT